MDMDVIFVANKKSIHLLGNRNRPTLADKCSGFASLTSFCVYFATAMASSNLTDNNFETPSFPIVTP
jgi:hypothetical protein